jgi:hypothetical protein
MIIAICPEGNEGIYYDVHVFFFTLLKFYNGNEEIVIDIFRG